MAKAASDAKASGFFPPLFKLDKGLLQMLRQRAGAAEGEKEEAFFPILTGAADMILQSFIFNDNLIIHGEAAHLRGDIGGVDQIDEKNAEKHPDEEAEHQIL